MGIQELESYYGVGTEELAYYMRCIDCVRDEVGDKLDLEDAFALMYVLMVNEYGSSDGFVVNDPSKPYGVFSRFDLAAIVAELCPCGHDADWFKYAFLNSTKESPEFEKRYQALDEKMVASGRLKRIPAEKPKRRRK